MYENCHYENINERGIYYRSYTMQDVNTGEYIGCLLFHNHWFNLTILDYTRGGGGGEKPGNSEKFIDHETG